MEIAFVENSCKNFNAVKKKQSSGKELEIRISLFLG